MMAEKYLGAPSDAGEWWCDIGSKAKDMIELVGMAALQQMYDAVEVV